MLGAAPLHAQDQDAQLWLSAGVSVALDDRWALDGETAQRFSDDDGGLYESQYVVTLGHEVADGVTLTGGYNRVVARDRTGITSLESRPRQQVTFPLVSIGAGRLSGRVRLEQRFRNDGDDTGHRVRPQIRYTLPLSEGGTRLNLSNESYFNFNTTDFGQIGGYERMRHAISLSIPVNNALGVEIGYLNQLRLNRGAPDEMAHAATIALSMSL